jgi:acyl-CoA thioester hydrolase
MNVMWYVGKFDEATWHFFNLLGLSPTFLRTAKRGMAAVEQHISYIAELHAGDIVTIRTELLEMKEKSLRFRHEMTNEETGVVAARTTLKGVHLDLEARKSCAFPQAVRDRADALLAARL